MIDRVVFVGESVKNCSVVLGIYSDGTLSENAKKINDRLGGAIKKNLDKFDFIGKTLFKTYSFPCAGSDYNHITMVGLGDPQKEFSKFELEKLGAAIYSGTKELDADVIVAIDAADLHFPCNCASSFVGFGALLKSWCFDKYKSRKDEKTKLKNL